MLLRRTRRCTRNKSHPGCRLDVSSILVLFVVRTEALLTGARFPPPLPLPTELLSPPELAVLRGVFRNKTGERNRGRRDVEGGRVPPHVNRTLARDPWDAARGQRPSRSVCRRLKYTIGGVSRDRKCPGTPPPFPLTPAPIPRSSRITARESRSRGRSTNSNAGIRPNVQRRIRRGFMHGAWAPRASSGLRALEHSLKVLRNDQYVLLSLYSGESYRTRTNIEELSRERRGEGEG